MLSLALGLASTPALASPRAFSVDSQDASRSLLEFGRQSAVQILFASEKVKGITTNAVHGNYEPIDALRLLLKDTSLIVSEKSDGILVVEPRGKNVGRSGDSRTHVFPPTPAAAGADQADLRMAQASPDPPSPPIAGGSEQSLTKGKPESLGEIVVSANKLNAQRVLDVPASIQAISGDSLRSAGASAFMDIAGQIPGLSVQDLGPGDKKYVIRGINSTGDSTTGIYYGEAVISGSNANDGGGFQSDIRLFDLDHVEVLRGPQGTLYGASSMSGTIRFIPKSPDLTTVGGYLSVEGSSTTKGSGNANVNGALNLPIIDGKAAMRLVAWKIDDSGFIDQIRVGTVGRINHVNNDDVTGGRAIFRFQATDDLTIDLSATGQHETAEGSSRYTPAGVTSWGAPGIPAVQGCDLCNTDVTRSPWQDDLQVYGLTVAYKTRVGTLTGTTNQYNRRLGFSFDSTPILASFAVPVPAETLEPQARHVNSSEIRFASDLPSPVNFVAGLYRQHETSNWVSNVITTNGRGEVIGAFSRANSDDALEFPGVGNTFFGQADHRTSNQYAGFGEATWKATQNLTVIGGIRYFTENLQGVQESTHPFGGFPPGAAVGPVNDPDQTFNKVTYKANIAYKFNDSALVYGTTSTGFRSGGLNPESEPFEPIPAAFSPDSLTNYEVGGKGRLFDGLLEYQTDFYLIDWKNIQVSETTADGTFPYVGNAGTARVKGFEFEFAARPVEYLTATFAGSYQDAYLTKGAIDSQKLINPTLGVTGEKIPNVPKIQFSLGLNYTRPMTGDWKAMAATDINYRDSVNAYFASNPFNIELSSYTLINLRLGILNDLWSVTAFARNLTDKRAQISAINSTQDPSGFLTVRPRTIGLTIARQF
jgi:iron complex outermembrane receptor protein